MRPLSPLSCLALVIATGMVAGIAPLAAQVARPRMWDDGAAQAGESIWKRRQCYGCHELGRQQSTGPDLIGVTDRRSKEWLVKWLRNPVAMTGDDSIGQALKKQFNSQMPNFGLSEVDANALINFFARVTWTSKNKDKE